MLNIYIYFRRFHYTQYYYKNISPVYRLCVSSSTVWTRELRSTSATSNRCCRSAWTSTSEFSYESLRDRPKSKTQPGTSELFSQALLMFDVKFSAFFKSAPLSLSLSLPGVVVNRRSSTTVWAVAPSTYRAWARESTMGKSKFYNRLKKTDSEDTMKPVLSFHSRVYESKFSNNKMNVSGQTTRIKKDSDVMLLLQKTKKDKQILLVYSILFWLLLAQNTNIRTPSTHLRRRCHSTSWCL